MKEQFIPYELAVKLKELGFDENTLAGYTLWQNPTLTEPTLLVHIPTGKYSRWSPIPDYGKYSHRTSDMVKAPLWQQAFDWFYNSKNLFQYIRIFNKKDFGFSIFTVYEDVGKALVYSSNYYNTYEEARLACLEKLIEIVENETK